MRQLRPQCGCGPWQLLPPLTFSVQAEHGKRLTKICPGPPKALPGSADFFAMQGTSVI